LACQKYFGFMRERKEQKDEMVVDEMRCYMYEMMMMIWDDDDNMRHRERCEREREVKKNRLISLINRDESEIAKSFLGTKVRWDDEMRW